MPAADLARCIQESNDETGQEIDLLDIPAKRLDLTSIDFQSTLQEAISVLNNSDAEALYVIRRTIPGINRIHGILTREEINSSYSID
jgi:hypothetical protein